MQQVKAALPAVLEVLYAISSESDEEEDSLYDLFCESILVGRSIQALCQKLVCAFCVATFLYLLSLWSHI